ncbi:hypothetical protein AURDEDRAFT_144875 [Auricularia subglabra TFB-10046 SS5]|nr:hypothetical protein AURDEDRAFT_144875 [Auricularia subglabra TFB-10046 SS5]
MPIAAKETEADDSQGSVSFFFHENRDKDGAPSNKVFGVSNKHVLCNVTTVDYEFKGGAAPRRFVRVCGDRRYKRFMAGTRGLVTKNVDECLRLAEQEETEETCVALEKFLKTTDGDFHGIARRGVGWVDWAPKIAIDVDVNRYTFDIGTLELDLGKFSDNFKGNVVGLGAKFEPHELNSMFWPNVSNPTAMKFPSNPQLKIRGVVTRELLANAMYVTVGRYTELEAYLCDEFGKESIEVSIYNYSRRPATSPPRETGSLVFTGDGRKLAVLHSGMPRGLSNHVPFGAPAWWVVERLMLGYKYADFDREALWSPP